jgi:PKD repeat protein
MVDDGSFDNCGVASVSVTPSIFGCADIGTNTVTLTVSDAAGNSVTCTTTVTVIGALPTCAISSVPGDNTYTGGDPNIIYLGYGPQSTTLASSVSGGSSFTYTWSGSNLSCTDCASPTFTPTAAGSQTFVLTVTNEYGCTGTCSITICVKDIRVPGQNGKVYICHYPVGNNSNPQTLSVSTSSVPSHLGQHANDKLGKCTQTGCTAAKESMFESGFQEHAELAIIASPNPFDEELIFYFEGSDTPAALTIYDLTGKKLDVRSDIVPHQEYSLGKNLQSGTYILEISQGSHKQVLRIVKNN